MSSLFDYKERMQENPKSKYGFIIVTLFLLWLFLPNYNGFIKSCYWANNFFYKVSKYMHLNDTPEYIHYRNNAVYLVQVYPKNPVPVYKEIDKAIASYTGNTESDSYSMLCRDSAVIKLYYGDKKGALADLMSIKKRDSNDNFRIAILLTEELKYKEAETYCKMILSRNYKSLSGYVCLANVYEKSGDIATAMRLYNYLAELRPNNEAVFIERSYFKKRTGDEKGAAEDISNAKSIYSHAQIDGISILEKAVNIEKLPLSIT